MLRTFVASSMSLMLLGCQAEPACKPGLVADLVEAGRHSRLAEANLTTVAQRHIPIGVPTQAAFERFRQADLHPVPEAPAVYRTPGMDHEYVVYPDKSDCAAIGSDRFVLIVGERQGTVVSVEAKRFSPTMP